MTVLVEQALVNLAAVLATLEPAVRSVAAAQTGRRRLYPYRGSSTTPKSMARGPRRGRPCLAVVLLRRTRLVAHLDQMEQRL
jgi:hypothetical protein